MINREAKVLIIGGGTAGYTCAMECSKQGLETILVEKESVLGGTGFRSGCLPVKFLLDQLKLTRKVEMSGRSLSVDRDALFQKCQQYMEETSQRMEKNLKKNGVQLLWGNGKFLDANTYQVDHPNHSYQIHAEKIVVATGTSPGYPEHIRPDEDKILTHREAVMLNKIPDSLLIIGGEVEGLEFASLFSELGSRVTVLEMMPAFLEGMDEDLKQPLFDRLLKNGVSLKSGCKVAEAEILPEGVKLRAESGEAYLGEKVIVAMSRKPNFPRGLQELEIEIKENRILTNKQCQTSLAPIYAIGDINGRMEMAHTAGQQGLFLGRHLAFNQSIPWEYEALPRAMFTIPENAGAGKQEKELIAEKTPYRKGMAYWKDTWRGGVQPWSQGHIKVLVDDGGILLGVWMTGLDIGEQVGFLGMMIQQKMKVSDIEKHLMVHPTLSEGILQAIGNIQ
ncbi:dihydrolipoyl dehydrogenase family protein [Tindallia californiensis]|uniref:Dihydrolipoamide dehydrogenase n=1 Tax=Tindallia californiensis TaxID=159292 RepID=A0A1H3LIS6_9FIRM|nr:NAD(P)/FAD-dependent oxidoreductase [Tindallia californiensis]SDY63854.1 dihydrolipoamide dehydrogenase [Tindallia californiensis]